jgi:hypothetical protein
LVDGHSAGILTELYIEALLVDEALPGEVWALWDAGVITDDMAAWSWIILARWRTRPKVPPSFA